MSASKSLTKTKGREMSSAIISTCGTYRYTLCRKINSNSRYHKPCLFVMLNPSTADANKDDPTIRRCIGFAEREDCTSLTVINLFAYRATDPKELVTASNTGVDIFGPENDHHIERELSRHDATCGHLIIAAWGAHLIAKKAIATRMLLRSHKARCLGRTKYGEPKHPLYIPQKSPLELWQ